MFSFQFLDQIRHELRVVANSIHTVDAAQLDSIESRRRCALEFIGVHRQISVTSTQCQCRQNDEVELTVNKNEEKSDARKFTVLCNYKPATHGLDYSASFVAGIA